MKLEAASCPPRSTEFCALSAFILFNFPGFTPWKFFWLHHALHMRDGARGAAGPAQESCRLHQHLGMVRNLNLQPGAAQAGLLAPRCCNSLWQVPAAFLGQGGKGDPGLLQWTANPPRASLGRARSGGPSWRDPTSSKTPLPRAAVTSGALACGRCPLVPGASAAETLGQNRGRTGAEQGQNWQGPFWAGSPSRRLSTLDSTVQGTGLGLQGQGFRLPDRPRGSVRSLVEVWAMRASAGACRASG